MNSQRRKLIQLPFVVATLGVLSVTPAYAIFGIGDIVFDPSQYANMLKQFVEYSKQLLVLKQQYEQARGLYNAVRGARGFGDVLLAGVQAGDMAYNVLPPEQRQALDLAHDAAAKFAVVYDDMAKLERNYKEFVAKSYDSMTPAQQKNWSDRIHELARNKSMSQVAYDQARLRDARIAAFNRKIGVADDMKAISELAVRVQTEQAQLTNHLIELQTMQWDQANKRAVAEQKEVDEVREQGHKDWKGEMKFPRP